MFEYEQDIVNTLLSEDDSFKRLFNKHGELNNKVDEANSGVHPLDDFALESMKKEKLMLRDQMAAIIANYKQTHTS